MKARTLSRIFLIAISSIGAVAFGSGNFDVSDVERRLSKPNLDTINEGRWTLGNTRAEHDLMFDSGSELRFKAQVDILEQPSRRKGGEPAAATVFDSLVGSGSYRQNLVETEFRFHRMISYLGYVALRLMDDLEWELDFGESSGWSISRGTTVEGSTPCEDGGGYDASVTRNDFTEYSGSVTAENCGVGGLTTNGQVSFTYNDDYWNQDSPMQNYPLVFTASNAVITDQQGRKYTYSGKMYCDWRFNASAITYSWYNQNPFMNVELTNFGPDYDDRPLFTFEFGTWFDYEESSGWIDGGLERNSKNKVSNYPLEMPNCDMIGVTVSHVGKTYKINSVKYIGESGQPSQGYRLDRHVRNERKLDSWGGEPELLYALDRASSEVLVLKPDRISQTGDVTDPQYGELNFSAGAGSPATYQYAYKGYWGSDYYQEVLQWDDYFLVQLSGQLNGFSGARSTRDYEYRGTVGTGLSRSGECGWVGSHLDDGNSEYTEYKIDSNGVCRASNFFEVQNGKIEFVDDDGDGIHSVIDSDDDNDGVIDSQDAFPTDPNESIDTDLDGEGDNADEDDDNDGVPDSDDAFPLDRTESSDTDDDGFGDNQDSDDDGDGQIDEQEIACGSDPLGYESTSPDNDADLVPDCVDDDDDGDGVDDSRDAFPLNSSESEDSDGDGVGDNSDGFPTDSLESLDTDLDGIGNNADTDDDGDGFSDEQEAIDGTNPLSRFSCRSGCFSFDVDESQEAQPLTDGLLVIRHLFGFSDDSLISGAVSGEAGRDSSEAITDYLTDSVSELDIDGDGESKPLTDGLLLIRYLFGFSGDSLVSGAIGPDAKRDTAEAVEAYIQERVPVK